MNVLLLLLLFSTSIRSVAASVRSRHESDAVVEVAEPLSVVVVVVAIAAQLLLLMLLLLGCCWLVLAELVVVVVLVVLDEDVAPEGTGSSVRRRAISRSRNTSVSLGSIRLKRLEWKGGNV